MNQNKKINKPTVSKRYPDGTMVELLYDHQEKQTSFCIWKDGTYEITDTYDEANGNKLVPFKPYNNLIQHKIVLFPSELEEYSSEKDLINQIQEYIQKNKYLQLL